MHHFAYRAGHLYCEDVALEAIASAIGTPVYVYSAATLERHLAVFRAAFSPRDIDIAFAVKANANVAVLATLAAAGAGADTVSAGEIARALKAGIPASRMIFSGVGKTKQELQYALGFGIGQINVESHAELEMLAELAQASGAKPQIAVRVNPDIAAGTHDKITTGAAENKFGVPVADALALYAQASQSPHLNPVGLAVHIGSQIKDLSPLRSAFLRLREMTMELRTAGYTVTRLDLGGGLGVPYQAEHDPPTPAAYAAVVENTLGDLDVLFSFEPGRLIAGNAGILLTRVIRHQPRPNRDIIVLDAGMNDLIRPAMYEAFHELIPVKEPKGAARQSFDLVGPVCETGDTFAKNRLLPPMDAGDLAVFMTAGAYGATMSSTYNGRALVPEVLVNGDQFAVVRDRIDIEQKLSHERLPPWMKAG